MRRRCLKKLMLVSLCLIALSVQPAGLVGKETTLTNRAVGTFEVKVARLAPYNQEDKTLARFSIDKQFRGDLEATSKGEMLSAGNSSTSGGYVAIEKVTGKLNGHIGSFVLQHSATMENGQPHLAVFVVPGSGSGGLSGISGTMDIVIEAGKHSYVFTYRL
jgi:hypothetical protein